MKTKYYWEAGSRTVVKLTVRGKTIRCYSSMDFFVPFAEFKTLLYTEEVGLKLEPPIAIPITYGQYIMWFVGFVNSPLDWKK